jgi:replicative DNA helicase
MIKKMSNPNNPSNTDVTFADVQALGTKSAIKSMFEKMAQYNKMLAEKITFVNKELTKLIPFTRENLYLFCAYTGSGKTTLVSNILHPLWKEKKKCLVLSNEETQEEIILRVACIELGLNFNSWKKGEMSLEDQRQAMYLFPQISEYIKIFDVTFKNGLTAKLEGIKSALEAVRKTDYSCVLIDYYQKIHASIDEPDRSKYNILYDLSVYLTQYIKNSNVPVAMCVQLHSIGKRNNIELDSRVKEGPIILEGATVVLELIPNFADSTTEIVIKKDRFGYTGKKITLGYDRGKFVPMTEEFKKKIAAKKIKELKEKIMSEKDNEEDRVSEIDEF